MPRRPNPADKRTGIARSDYVTLDSLRMKEVFICWREGSRLPNSYHATLPEARATALARLRAGDTMCILRAEIVTSLTAVSQVTERNMLAVTAEGTPAQFLKREG